MLQSTPCPGRKLVCCTVILHVHSDSAVSVQAFHFSFKERNYLILGTLSPGKRAHPDWKVGMGDEYS